VDQIARRFVSPVGDVEAPRAVHRLAGFERQLADLRVLVEFGRLTARQILLEHLEILAGEWTAMMVGADERLRLELVNQCIGGVELPRRLGAIPPAIEPDAADLAIV